MNNISFSSVLKILFLLPFIFILQSIEAYACDGSDHIFQTSPYYFTQVDKTCPLLGNEGTKIKDYKNYVEIDCTSLYYTSSGNANIGSVYKIFIYTNDDRLNFKKSFNGRVYTPTNSEFVEVYTNNLIPNGKDFTLSSNTKYSVGFASSGTSGLLCEKGSNNYSGYNIVKSTVEVTLNDDVSNAIPPVSGSDYNPDLDNFDIDVNTLWWKTPNGKEILKLQSPPQAHQNMYFDFELKGKAKGVQPQGLAVSGWRAFFSSQIQEDINVYINQEKYDYNIANCVVDIHDNVDMTGLKDNGYYNFTVKGKVLIPNKHIGSGEKINIQIGFSALEEIPMFGFTPKYNWLVTDTLQVEVDYYVDQNGDGKDDDTGEVIPPSVQPIDPNHPRPPSDNNGDPTNPLDWLKYWVDVIFGFFDSIINNVSNILKSFVNMLKNITQILPDIGRYFSQMYSWLPSPLPDIINMSIMTMCVIAVVRFLRG